MKLFVIYKFLGAIAGANLGFMRAITHISLVSGLQGDSSSNLLIEN